MDRIIYVKYNTETIQLHKKTYMFNYWYFLTPIFFVFLLLKEIEKQIIILITNGTKLLFIIFRTFANYFRASILNWWFCPSLSSMVCYPDVRYMQLPGPEQCLMQFSQIEPQRLQQPNVSDAPLHPYRLQVTAASRQCVTHASYAWVLCIINKTRKVQFW